MSDQPDQERPDVGDAADDPVATEQQGKGYGEDEGEREQSLPDE